MNDLNGHHAHICDKIMSKVVFFQTPQSDFGSVHLSFYAYALFLQVLKGSD